MWPVGVAGAFDLPLWHLAFDQPGAGSEPAGGVDSPAEQGEGVGPEPVSVLRGKNRALVRASDG